MIPTGALEFKSWPLSGPPESMAPGATFQGTPTHQYPCNFQRGYIGSNMNGRSGVRKGLYNCSMHFEPWSFLLPKGACILQSPNTGTFCRRPVVRPSPFSIDPGLHSKITAADWANLQRQVKVTLAPGTLVAIRIKFGIDR